MFREFEEYVSNFDLNDRGINRKLYHSKRVSIITTKIASELNWKFHDVFLAKQIGLLHDIGRFEEWVQFKKYGQNKFDHGDYGVKILKKNNFIDKFNINEYDKENLYLAIKYHNKYKVPAKYNNKFVKLIRDADKLDILYLHTIDDNLYTYNNNFSNTISLTVKRAFLNEKSVLVPDVKSYGDFIVMTLAFIFDLNYDYSLRYLKENRYLEKIYEKLENKEIYEGYFNKIFTYIEKRSKNVR